MQKVYDVIMIKRKIELEQEQLLRDLIAETVILEKMAYDRDHFIEKLDEYLTGAIREFYKARLAEKYFGCRNQDVNHWYLEVHRLLTSFEEAYVHKVKGFSNKEKAFQAAKADVQAIDAERRRRATAIIINDYELTTLENGITDNDTNDFWDLVDSILDGNRRAMTNYLLDRK